MSVEMVAIAEEKIEAPQKGVGNAGTSTAAVEAVLADAGRGVTGLLEHAAERMIVFERIIKLVVAHAGVALMNARQQGGARRGADGRRAVMPRICMPSAATLSRLGVANQGLARSPAAARLFW